MKQEQVALILDNLDTPVSKIELDLDMPSGTLAKAKKGVRDLPEKWDSALAEYWYKNSHLSKDATRSISDNINSVLPSNTILSVGKKGIEEKRKTDTLRDFREKINKDFGAGTLMLMGDKERGDYEVISTGSIGLDLATGIGGLPRGRIVEIYGPESSGKTTISTHIMANAQEMGLKCLFIDAENSFDPAYASAIGVKIKDLDICQPTYGEEGLEVADRAICTGEYGVVVIDSVAALVPKGELEGQMGDSKMGLHARLMSQACRKMAGVISKTNTLCVFINQIRMNIGGYGNPEVVTGGKALGFYSSMRIEVRRVAQIKDGEVSIGNRTKAKISKNKCAAPYCVAEFDITFGEGISKISELIDFAVENNIIQKGGAWYSYNDSKLGQGKESAKKVLKDNPEMAKEIKRKVLTLIEKNPELIKK